MFASAGGAEWVWSPLRLWRWFIMGPSLPLFSPKVGQTQIRGTQHTQWMPAYSCLQPRHTYTDNNPQLNRCSSVNISWMADSLGLIIFSDLCLGIVFAFMNYKCMAKFVGKILISWLLHKVAVHSGKCVSAAHLCGPNLFAGNRFYQTFPHSASWNHHCIELADKKRKPHTQTWRELIWYGKVHLLFLLCLWELILTFCDEGTKEMHWIVENKILITTQNDKFDWQFWINLHHVGVAMVLPNPFNVRR